MATKNRTKTSGCGKSHSHQSGGIAVTMHDIPAPSLDSIILLRRGARASSQGGNAAGRARIQWTDALKRDLLSLYEKSEPARRRLEDLWSGQHPNLQIQGKSLAARCRKLRNETSQPQLSQKSATTSSDLQGLAPAPGTSAGEPLGTNTSEDDGATENLPSGGNGPGRKETQDSESLWYKELKAEFQKC